MYVKEPVKISGRIQNQGPHMLFVDTHHLRVGEIIEIPELDIKSDYGTTVAVYDKKTKRWVL